MATQMTNVRFQARRDDSTVWAVNNPVLLPGEFGLETDTGYLKIGDGVHAWNTLPYVSSGGSGSGSGAYSQRTKLECAVGESFTITVPQTSNFCRPPMEVLKFVSASTGILLTASSFSNGDATDFIFDTNNVVFDGQMHPRNSFPIALSTPTAFGSGYISSASVSFLNFGSVEAFTPPDFRQDPPTIGIALEATGGGNGSWGRIYVSGDVTRATIYVSNNVGYAVTENGFEAVISDWASATDSAKQAAFQSIIGEATFANLVLLGAFTIYCYSTDNNAYTYTVTGTPAQKQLVMPRGLLALSQYEAIKGVSITHSVGTNSSIKIAVTPDLIHYYSYDFSANQWLELSGTITADLIYQYGIPIANLSLIPDEDFTSLMQSVNNELGFAYSLYQYDSTESCMTDELVLTVDAKGTWRKAVNGTDYRYDYTGNTEVTVTALTAGDYKVNYDSGTSSAS